MKVGRKSTEGINILLSKKTAQLECLGDCRISLHNTDALDRHGMKAIFVI